MILLGETVTPPVEFAGWIACLTFTVMLVNGVMKLVRNVKGPASHPPAGELDLRVVTVERDLKRVESTVVNVEAQVRQLRADIVTNGEIRKNAIEAKVESVRCEMGERMDAQSAVITDMPNRIIAILRNTNSLKR